MCQWAQGVLLCASPYQVLRLVKERSESSLVLTVLTCGKRKMRDFIPGVWDSPLTSTPHSSSVPYCFQNQEVSAFLEGVLYSLSS